MKDDNTVTITLPRKSIRPLAMYILKGVVIGVPRSNEENDALGDLLKELCIETGMPKELADQIYTRKE